MAGKKYPKVVNKNVWMVEGTRTEVKTENAMFRGEGRMRVRCSEGG